eukprot:688943-Pyramimonas_sp.AAC.1
MIKSSQTGRLSSVNRTSLAVNFPLFAARIAGAVGDSGRAGVPAGPRGGGALLWGVRCRGGAVERTRGGDRQHRGHAPLPSRCMIMACFTGAKRLVLPT